MGADAAIEITNEIAGPVALVAAIDPSRFAALPVPANVAVVLNYYKRMGVNGRFFGRGVVSTAEGFKGRITRVERDEPHTLIDRDPEIHSAIIAEIMNLLRWRAASRAVRRKLSRHPRPQSGFQLLGASGDCQLGAAQCVFATFPWIPRHNGHPYYWWERDRSLNHRRLHQKPSR